MRGARDDLVKIFLKNVKIVYIFEIKINFIWFKIIIYWENENTKRSKEERQGHVPLILFGNIQTFKTSNI